MQDTGLIPNVPYRGPELPNQDDRHYIGQHIGHATRDLIEALIHGSLIDYTIHLTRLGHLVNEGFYKARITPHLCLAAARDKDDYRLDRDSASRVLQRQAIADLLTMD